MIHKYSKKYYLKQINMETEKKGHFITMSKEVKEMADELCKRKHLKLSSYLSLLISEEYERTKKPIYE